MSLMIDIGNTKTKYAYFVDGTIKEKGSCRTEDTSKIIDDYSGIVKNIMLSSVRPIPKSILSKSKNRGCRLIVLSSKLEMPLKFFIKPQKQLEQTGLL